MSGKKEKKKQKKTPVMTGGDFRAVERSAAENCALCRDGPCPQASAPDGVSGYWK